MAKYIVTDPKGNVLFKADKNLKQVMTFCNMGEEKVKRMMKEPFESDTYRIYKDTLPDVLWLVVTHDKYELPIAVFDSGQELIRELNLSAAAVYSAIKHAEERNCFCKYKRVYIGDLEDE